MMPITIGGRRFLLPKDVQKKYQISDTKLRRLASREIIPSIATGSRGETGMPEYRLYDEEELEQVPDYIWKKLRTGAKTSGNAVYYSQKRSKRDTVHR